MGRVPLDDVAAVIVHAHGTTWSANLIVALAQRGAVMMVCGSNRAPVAVCHPLDGHQAQNSRMRAQWEASKPLSKQLWRRIVIAKIRWQAVVLEANGLSSSAFDLLARRVGSGDPENVEAQAARRYWPLLMGEGFSARPGCRRHQRPAQLWIYGDAFIMRARRGRIGPASLHRGASCQPDQRIRLG